MKQVSGTSPAHGAFSRRLLAIVDEHRLQPILDRLLETKRGFDASHQTGWTALLANLIDETHRPGAGPHRLDKETRDDE